ncbi:penicillin-binding protein [Streptacidiphilus sp. PB12-B1b]|uniref:transglycosylase domain-containing protein n=1 Tax=Streptacidiphilus sp. PB12-B1b TaxID=2705012 RepID=UPI0015F82529|nr:transglycosylase domain-containing protein [Streptacidiphilus sp. PB12-B1b]QMU74644.1 penicillin-binding protein [Streptacidiphilus sp. PB12-B1b]
MAVKRSGSPLNKVGLGVRLLGASVLAGALVAGLGLPAVGAVGLGAKAAVKDFNTIPDNLKIPTLSQASTIYDADGGVIAKVFSEDRTSVPLSKIAPIMQNALIDIEDHRFYQHGAIDLEGTLRALLKNSSSGDVSQGGSTLTQQYVKNVFINNAGDANSAGFAEATRQTTGRKIQELRYAIKLEETLSKQQILDDYLNITYFGEGAYGIEAAAELYFSVHASQLSIPQAAMLAGLEQSPSAYDPTVNPQAATQRRNTVLAAMATYGTITQAQAAKAEAAPLGLKVTWPKTGCITAQKGEGFFCNYVKNIVLQDPAFGATSDAREALWNAGGLQIHTTLNPKDQAAEEKAVSDHAYPSDAAAAATSMVQPGTGDILAMAQSRPYGTGKNETEINYNVNALYGGAQGFQTGSVFKAITAATALSQGIPLSYEINSVVSGDYPEMTDCSGHVMPEQPGMENDDDTKYGNINMVKAMADSVNTYFVPLEQQVGLCNVVHMAQSFGLGYQGTLNKSGTGLLPISQTQTLTLGVNSLTPLQIANAYAAFAADGMYCNATAITRVTNAAGKNLPVPSPDCHQAVTPSVAEGVNTLLASVVSDEGTGATVGIPWSDAGKTGTTNSENQAWFAGYTKQISDATVMTNPNYPTSYSLDHTTIGGVYYDTAYGYLTSGPIWKQAMMAAMSGLPDITLDFAPSPGGGGSQSSTTGGTTGGTTTSTGGNGNNTGGNGNTGGNTGGNSNGNNGGTNGTTTGFTGGGGAGGTNGGTVGAAGGTGGGGRNGGAGGAPGGLTGLIGGAQGATGH